MYKRQVHAVVRYGGYDCSEAEFLVLPDAPLAVLIDSLAARVGDVSGCQVELMFQAPTHVRVDTMTPDVLQ